MRRRALAAVLFTLGATPLLFARIGESPEACDQRYGPPLKAGSPTRGFWATEQRHEKNGFRIVVRFLRHEDGTFTAGYVEYTPMNPSDFSFTDERTRSLLEIVSTEWTKLAPIPLPPPPVPINTATNSIRTLARTSKVKVITIEQTGGIEERRRKQEAAERKALVDSIESQNRETKRVKDLLGKVTRPDLTCWRSPEAYAAGNNSLLIIISRAYLAAYEKQIADTAAALQKF